MMMNKKALAPLALAVIMTFSGTTLAVTSSNSSDILQDTDMTTAAKNGCAVAVNARKQARQKKAERDKSIYAETVGKKLERIAKNCAEALSKVTVPYISISPDGVINAILNGVNNACMNVANKAQEEQNKTYQGFSKQLPYGLGGTGTKQIGVDSSGRVQGGGPIVDINSAVTGQVLKPTGSATDVLKGFE